MKRLIQASVLGWMGAQTASAYPFMIEHGYTGCSECHVAPSGGSVLTSYGRAQSEILMRMPYGKAEAEPGRSKDFAWAVPLPDSVQLQPEFRGLLIPQPGNVRGLVMQADLKASASGKRVIGTVTAGVVSEGAREALLTKDERDIRVVMREAWVGWRASESVTFTAGRMALPFGIRTDEHLLFSRNLTRTDTNDDQQAGLAVAWRTAKLRGEGMAVVGNPSIRQDRFRERGFSVMAAWAPMKRLEVGGSSLLTRAAQGQDSDGPSIRQAHAVFARWSPYGGVGVLTEVDWVSEGGNQAAVVDASVDVEPTQGLHIAGGVDVCRLADETHPRGRAAVRWFALPHVELRMDGFYGPLRCVPGATPFPSVALQAHVYL